MLILSGGPAGRHGGQGRACLLIEKTGRRWPSVVGAHERSMELRCRSRPSTVRPVRPWKPSSRMTLRRS